MADANGYTPEARSTFNQHPFVMAQRQWQFPYSPGKSRHGIFTIAHFAGRWRCSECSRIGMCMTDDDSKRVPAHCYLQEAHQAATTQSRARRRGVRLAPRCRSHTGRAFATHTIEASFCLPVKLSHGRSRPVNDPSRKDSRLISSPAQSQQGVL